MTARVTRNLAFAMLVAVVLLSRTEAVKAAGCWVYNVDYNGLTIDAQLCGPSEYNPCYQDPCNDWCAGEGMYGGSANYYYCDFYEEDGWYLTAWCVCWG